ncbi:MAG: hypothetical protein H0U49_05415 [Parachlamydiaceae bacterium]|nr:hypothetical protein [Parachlamydiaceae bacterium]
MNCNIALKNNSAPKQLEFQGINYNCRSLNKQYWEISKRIFGIAAVCFASLLILPIAAFVTYGTYQTIRKWAFELGNWKIIDSKISNTYLINPLSTNTPQKMHPEQVDQLSKPVSLAVLDDMVQNKNNSRAGYSMLGQDILLMLFFLQKGGVYIDTEGKTADGVELSGKIAYASHFSLYENDEPNCKPNVEALTNFLRRENDFHPSQRPAKIIIPFYLNSYGKTPHAVLLVIEPDPQERNKANITMVNPHGDGLKSYHSEENMILNAAKKAYRNSNAIRNKKTAYSGAYCGIDCVENARYLAGVSNVYEHIKQSMLPSRSHAEIAKIRLEHAEECIIVAEELRK